MLQLTGQFVNDARDKYLFSTANQATTVTTVGLATTYTGLCLTNPAIVGTAPGFNGYLYEVGFSFPVAPAAVITVGIMSGFLAAGVTTHGTAVAADSGSIGNTNPGPRLIAYDSCTLVGTPFLRKVLATIYTGAVTTMPTGGKANFSIDGQIEIVPGSWVAIYTSTASAASGFIGSFLWAERRQ